LTRGYLLSMRAAGIVKGSLKFLTIGTAGIATLLAAMFVTNRLPYELPRPTGPFAVGRTHFAWVEHRTDELAPRSGVDRQIFAWVWYPAQRGTGTPAVYLPPRWRAALARPAGILMTDFLTRDLAKVRVHAYSNALPAATLARFPVVLLFAGNGALVTFYTTLAEDLASHGYVVVGLEAAYRTTVVVLPSGVIYRPWRDNPEDLPESQADAMATRLVRMWSTDAGFVLDRLAALNSRPGTGFTGRLDLRHVGVVGHSLGGAIAAEFCRTDSRCAAGIDLDGRLFGPVITEGLNKPFMLEFESALSQSNPATARIYAQVHSMYAHLPADSRLGLSVAGANHFSFTDQVLVKNPILMSLMGFSGVFGNLGGRRGLRIIEDSVTAFLDVYVKGQSERNLREVVAGNAHLRVWGN
jgi:dienelactone hydrolase